MRKILEKNNITTERIIRLKKRLENGKSIKPVKKDIFAFSYFKYRHEHPFIQQAKALVDAWILSPVVIEEDELIVGGNYLDQMIKLDYKSRIRPSWCWEISIQKSSEVMHDGRNWKNLDANWEVIFDKNQEAIEYFKRIISNPINPYQEYVPLSYLNNKGFCPIPTCLGTITAGTAHLTGDYKELLSIGITGIKKKIINSMLKHKGNVEREKLLESLLILCDGIIKYSKNYSDKARIMAEKESNKKRKEELMQISKICSRVPEYPPVDFYEALQSIFFIQILEGLGGKNMDSPGRFDQYMYPFYKKTINEGSQTKSQIQELIDAFWIKCDRFNIWNLCLGGLTPDGQDGCNELTEMCLSSIERLRLRMPNSTFRWNSKTDDKIFRYVVKILSTGTALPALYNDEIIISAFEKIGIPAKDARDYCMAGCNNIHIGGKSNFGSPDADKFSVAKPLEWALFNGYCNYHKRQESIETGKPSDFKTFEDVLNAYKKQLRYALNWVAKNCNILQEYRAGNLPRLYKSLFIHDCIEKARSIDDKGAKYNGGTFWLIGFANVADSLAAIKKVVYEKKIISLEKLCEILKNNFSDNESLRMYLRNRCPKFGNNNSYVDDIMTEITQFCFEELKKIPTWRGGCYLGQVAAMFRYIELGKELCATPDGRLAGEPLANSIGAQDGLDRKGPTALINSVGKIAQVDAPCGVILNMRFMKDDLKGDKNIDSLMVLLKQYFLKGGQQVQLTVINADELKDAQCHPEKYYDLFIKVGGYVERFIDLNKEQQDNIIRRTELTVSGV